MSVEDVYLRRRKLKVMQRPLAAKLGVSVATLIDIETGKVDITDTYLERMRLAVDQVYSERQQPEGVVA